jgi:hypothetical protein
MPGVSVVIAAYPRLLGMPARTSLSSVRTVCELCTSTTGVSPDTVTVSSRAPTFKSPFTVAMNVAVSSMPSRLNVLKPGSENVTAYTPGLRSTMRY